MELQQLVNYEAERALTASLIHNNLTLDKIRHYLRPSHFADKIYASIYDAICSTIDAGKIADHITLKPFFETDDLLKKAGGSKFLQELLDSLITVMNAEHYADLIYNLYQRRQLVHIGKSISTKASVLSHKESSSSVILQAEEDLYKLQNDRLERSSFFQPFSHLLDTTLTTIQREAATPDDEMRLPTGFTDLDRILAGLHPSDLVIVAARPAMGKTALVTNIAFHVSKHCRAKKIKKNGVVAFFSLEMSGEQLASRILSAETRVSSEKMRKGHVTEKDLSSLKNVTDELSSLPLYVDDTPALSVSDLKSRCRRLSLMQDGLALVVVDYLQLLQGGRPESRVQEISEITRGLKMLAKEISVPVIALSQLSRAVEQRDDKTPRLSDLRESGSIEQDADVVLFIYRKGYYQKDATPEMLSDTDVIIAKHRHGPTGRIKLFFDPNTTTFKNSIVA
ncbi:MAG: replicative DNA helicase [Alphaproteobacteria bacterium]|nr:replicative DNA helicase [Alphaproteobacteria bacterium]